MNMIARDVWQLSGFPKHMFNIYLVEDVLIDTATRWARRRIFRQLRERDLSMVALTHCHPDHQGNAKFVCERFDVPLACHEGDVAATEGRAAMLPQNWLIRLGVRRWGGPPCLVDRVLQEGDEVAGFRVIHAPGHTPGHIMFFRESDRLVIAGDVLANMNFLTWQPGLREPPWFFSADPAENRRSMKKLVDLKPALVCFGHGPPLTDLGLLERFVTRLQG